MRRDDVDCSLGNGGFRRIGLASRSGEAGRILLSAMRAVEIGKPPNVSAPQLPSDLHFELPALESRKRRIRRDSHRDFRMILEYPQLVFDQVR
jgi:hypothetical protein